MTCLQQKNTLFCEQFKINYSELLFSLFSFLNVFAVFSKQNWHRIECYTLIRLHDCSTIENKNVGNLMMKNHELGQRKKPKS